MCAPQVEQLNRSLEEKDKELAALEESLDLLAPAGPGGERALKGNVSAADADRLEALQAWMSSGSSKQGERIKCALFTPCFSLDFLEVR